MVVAKEDVTVCPKCGGAMKQDEDVLDTWFSSALWPFSTMGWPEKTPELEKFYPTSVLVTAYDIIFFWVARMIFSGMEHMKEVPFRHVFMHGLVRDSQGRKMSKSLGNGIDPLEIIDQYGADALRFTLATGNSPGNDMRFYTERVEASRNFANKLWNAARFVLMNIDHETDELPEEAHLCMEDKWILTRLNTVIREVSDNLDHFEMGVAVQKLYDFIWDEFCDWYIELVKPRLYDAQGDSSVAAKKVLAYVLSRTLELLHPFMPFITEEIWQHLPHEGETIVRAPWPKETASYPQESQKMMLIQQAIKAVRNARAEKNVPPSKKAKLFIVTHDTEIFAVGKLFFEKMASASEVVITEDSSVIPPNAVKAVVEGAQIAIPMDELVNREEEIARLEKEKERLQQEIRRVEGKLSNEGFLKKAPEKVVAEEKAKGEKYKEMLKMVEESLASFQ